MNNGAILPTSAASSLICLDQVTGRNTGSSRNDSKDSLKTLNLNFSINEKLQNVYMNVTR